MNSLSLGFTSVQVDHTIGVSSRLSDGILELVILVEGENTLHSDCRMVCWYIGTTLSLTHTHCFTTPTPTAGRWTCSDDSLLRTPYSHTHEVNHSNSPDADVSRKYPVESDLRSEVAVDDYNHITGRHTLT